MKASDTCEIEGCGRRASTTVNGIQVCERCATDFVSVGPGAVRFDGRWHGVGGGAVYTPAQAAACPGLQPDEVQS